MNLRETTMIWESPPYNDNWRLAVYVSSKALGDMNCWCFVQEYKPAFILNAVLTNYNIGRILSKEQPSSMGGWYKKVWEEDAETLKLLRD